MTMNLIKQGTPRAGFKDWPTYDNKPGKEEPEIARCAIPDPDWEKEPPTKTCNTSKTQHEFMSHIGVILAHAT